MALKVIQIVAGGWGQRWCQEFLPVNVRDGESIKTVPAGLSVFRIGDDGKLTFARTYDVDVGDKTMFWMGMVAP